MYFNMRIFNEKYINFGVRLYLQTKIGIGTYSCARLEVAWLYGGRKNLGVYTSKPLQYMSSNLHDLTGVLVWCENVIGEFCKPF